MHRPGPFFSKFPDREASTMDERERGPTLFRFILAYILTILFGAVIALTFLAPIERHERRSALDRQEAFSGYRVASQEQAR